MTQPAGETERALGALSIFSGLPPEAVAAAADRAVLRSYPRSATLFRKGEPCHGLYALVHGRVQIYRSASGGREQTVHFIDPGMPLAQVPVFDRGPYPASARAVVDSRVAFIPLDRFRALYREYPDLADAVILDLGRRLRRMVGLVERISLKDVTARVAITLAEEAGRDGGLRDGVEVAMPWTHSELASELATTRESVARAFSHLRRTGAIEAKGGRLVVRNAAALTASASG